ncbi:hypothetical protein IMZ48_48270 [Candidatus Bathyarchaeota archaeon]|nr:hypothetical protein [Candidatus Bathyarchaeota archaeon]
MPSDNIKTAIDEVFARWEHELPLQAQKFDPMAGGALPLTYIGRDYAVGHIGNVNIPRIFVLSINQSRGGDKKSLEDVRQSLREIRQDDQERYKPDGFGPRALAANLTRWILMSCGVPKNALCDPATIHDRIAYDNFVKWSFDTPNSEPPNGAWSVFYGINKEIMEVLQPEIILCLGSKSYNHIWNAVSAEKGYSCPQPLPDWTYALTTPHGTAHVGRCYHYSNPRWPRRAWKLIQQGKPLPRNVLDFAPKPERAGAITLEEEMRQMHADDEHYPWWINEYAGQQFTEYNEYARWIASKICEKLAAQWQSHVRRTS